jgi:uncharacterized protein YgbK (DUF1537 family)
MIAKTTDSLRGAAQTLRADGPTALWVRMRLREQAEYQDWLEERDIVMVIAALRRLSERQLERLGMSHRTLALDVEDLVQRARREREIGRDALELVEPQRDRIMAAE